MASFFVKLSGQALVPSSMASQIQMAKLPFGVYLRAVITQPRNIKQLRLFWAFATYVADALNDGPTNRVWTQDDAVNLCKIATGHTFIAPLPKKDAARLGVTHAAVLKSISFGKMSGEDFDQFMNQSLAYIRDEVCPWIESSDHWPAIRTILTESGMIGADLSLSKADSAPDTQEPTNDADAALTGCQDDTGGNPADNNEKGT